MRENELLAPQRQLAPVAEKPHAGSIVTSEPNQMWGADATATVTLAEGQVTVLAAIDHCTAECVGIHAVKRATRFEALEPLRQSVREPEGNGCIERFFRTLKEQLLWVRHFQNLEELQFALREFRDRYNRERLIERLCFQSPRQARERLLTPQQAA